MQNLSTYVQAVQDGTVKPAARPFVAARAGATATVDGAWGWGQPTARLATQTVIALAAPLATTYDPEQTQLDQKLLQPSAAHWLGTA